MMAKIIRKRLGDILVGSGKINTLQLNSALSTQKIIKKKLGEVLIESGIVSEIDIIDAIQEQTDISKVDLSNIKYDNKAIKIIPQNLCRKYILAPFGFEDNKIKVALVDPLNMYAIDDVSISTGLDVIPYIATKQEIQRFIEVNYSSESVNRAVEEMKRESQINKNAEVQDLEEIDNIKNAPVVKMIDQLLKMLKTRLFPFVQ
jgi:type IV pilus assembly protein PilB